MKKRIMAIAIAVCMLFSLNITADARGVLSSEYIDNIIVGISPLGNSGMKVYVIVTANTVMSKVGISSLEIEEAKSINGPWSVKKTWSCSGSTYYDNNVDTYIGSFSFTGTPGYYYRAHTTGYAFSSASSGDETFASSYAQKCT